MKQVIARLVSMVLSLALVQACFGQDISLANVGERVRMVATADGTPPFTYVWFKDGVPVPEVTGPEFIINQVTLSDTATYSLEVSNTVGSARSNELRFRVLVLPKEATDTYEVLGLWTELRKDFAIASLPKCLKYGKSKGGQT